MTTLNYQLTSQYEDRPYLMLLHGLFGSLDNLSMVRKGFSDNYNVLSVDLPDHGLSPHSQTPSLLHYGDQVYQLLQQLNIESCVVLGHSLGGKIAMTLALSKPDLFQALVVADIAPVHYEPRHENVFKGLQNVDLAQISSRSDADILMAQYIQESGVRQFLLKSLVNEGGRWQWRFNLQGLLENYDALSGWKISESVFNSPTLFVKGGQSDYLTSAHQSVVKKLFPQSQAKIMQSAGHWLHAENPTIFNRLVDRFLTEIQ